MERIILVNCAVLCIVLLVEVVLSAPHYDNQLSVRTERNDGQQQSQLWFGPRLGRKKRNPMGEDPYRNAELATLMDIIQDSPWAVVAFNEGKWHSVGKELGEDSGDRWLEGDLTADLLSQRSPSFIPRLGRRMSPFSPRLGRETYKNQVS